MVRNTVRSRLARTTTLKFNGTAPRTRQPVELLCTKFPRERHRHAPIGKFTWGEGRATIVYGIVRPSKERGRQIRRPQDNTLTRYNLYSVAEQGGPIRASSDYLLDHLMPTLVSGPCRREEDHPKVMPDFGPCGVPGIKPARSDATETGTRVLTAWF